MTTSFVPVLSGDAALLLPRDVADTRPPDTASWPDELLLGLPAESIAHADDQTVVEALNAHRRARCRIAANEARLLARLNELRDGDRYVGDGFEMRTSRHAATDRVEQSTRLVEELPTVLAAMDDGEIDSYTAGRVADAADSLSAEDAAVLNERIAKRYVHGELKVTDPPALLRQIKRMIQRIDPGTAVTRARQARCERNVQLVPGQDTMSTLIADLPAEVAASAYARIDTAARRLRNNGDPRTLDQLRADVFADLLTGRAHSSEETPPPPRALVYLHVPVGTALGITDDGATLAGYGPLPGPVARDIMSRPDSVLRKVLEDPTTGQITGFGRRRRRPNAAMRDAVRARDRECTFCHRPAAICDLDHQAEWVRDRGPTDTCNLSPKMRTPPLLERPPRLVAGVRPHHRRSSDHYPRRPTTRTQARTTHRTTGPAAQVQDRRANHRTARPPTVLIPIAAPAARRSLTVLVGTATTYPRTPCCYSAPGR